MKRYTGLILAIVFSICAVTAFGVRAGSADQEKLASSVQYLPPIERALDSFQVVISKWEEDLVRNTGQSYIKDLQGEIARGKHLTASLRQKETLASEFRLALYLTRLEQQMAVVERQLIPHEPNALSKAKKELDVLSKYVAFVEKNMHTTDALLGNSKSQNK